MDFLSIAKKWIAQVTQIFIILVPLAVVLQVLFGDTTQMFGSVVQNLINIINDFSRQGLIGLVALGIVAWIFGQAYSSSR